jgi:hypothetical protein
MGVLDIAESMRARMPWSVAQRIFRSNEFPRGQGWDKTIERLRKANPKSLGAENDLETALVDHYHCGEKAVRLFQLSLERRNTLRDRLSHIKIEPSVFQKCFPLLVPAEDLPDEYNSPVPVSLESSQSGTVAIFASVRTVSVREIVDVTSMPSRTTEELAGYDEIIGVRHIRH